MIRSYASLFTVLSASIALCGCGGSPSQAGAADRSDARFATADSLLQHYNALTSGDPVDAHAVFALVHAENQMQRELLEAMEEMLGLTELDRLMFDEFGAGIDPEARNHMLAPDQPATFTHRDESRAQARLIDSEDQVRTLHLVKVGDSWWVSGNTYEYDPEIQAYEGDVSDLRESMRLLSNAAPGVVKRIRNGSIRNAAGARNALAEAALAQR